MHTSPEQVSVGNNIEEFEAGSSGIAKKTQKIQQTSGLLNNVLEKRVCQISECGKRKWDVGFSTGGHTGRRR